MDDLKNKAVEAVTALFDAKASLVITDANSGRISWGELADTLGWLLKQQDAVIEAIDECW